MNDARFPDIKTKPLCEVCGDMFERRFELLPFGDSGRRLREHGSIVDARSLPQHIIRDLTKGSVLRSAAFLYRDGQNYGVRLAWGGLCSNACWQAHMKDWRNVGRFGGTMFNRVRGKPVLIGVDEASGPSKTVSIKVKWNVVLE